MPSSTPDTPPADGGAPGATPRVVVVGHSGIPLRGELVGLHSARRGDYRVIYGVVENTGTVEVVHIDRRSDIYRQ